MKIAQMDGNRVHWLFTENAFPEFHPSIVLLDVTSVEDIQEGYIYDEATSTFSPPQAEPTPEPTPEPNVVELIQNLQDTNLFLMMSLADIYSELVSLKGGE